MSPSHKGILFAIVASFFHAAMATFVKLAVDVPNVALIFFRNLICLLLVVPFFFQKTTEHLKTARFPLHLVRACFGILAVYCFYYAIKHLHLVNALLLINTMPLFVPLVTVVWRRTHVPMARWIALLVGFIGVVIILRPGANLQFMVLPTVVGLCGGLFGAIALVSLRQLGKTESTRTILMYFFLMITVISFFPILFSDMKIPNLQMWIYVLLVGLFACLFQFYMARAYQNVPATKASVCLYFNLLFGGLIGWLFWGNLPDLYVLVGSFFIVIGGLIAVLSKDVPARNSR